MSAPPKPLRINREDFPDAPDWFDDLARQVNEWAKSVTDTLQGSVSADNLQVHDVTRELVTPASPAADTPPFPVLITPSFSAKPTRVTVSKVENLDSGAANSSPISCDWKWDGKLVLVRYVHGLSASTRYAVTFRVE
jgi:hypothetical protein